MGFNKNKKIVLFWAILYTALFLASSVITILNIANNKLNLMAINVIAVVACGYSGIDKWIKFIKK